MSGMRFLRATPRLTGFRYCSIEIRANSLRARLLQFPHRWTHVCLPGPVRVVAEGRVRAPHKVRSTVRRGNAGISAKGDSATMADRPTDHPVVQMVRSRMAPAGLFSSLQILLRSTGPVSECR